MKYTNIEPGRLYLLPSGRIARCYAVGQVYAAFEYAGSREEVTLCITFCRTHLSAIPAHLSSLAVLSTHAGTTGSSRVLPSQDLPAPHTKP